MDIVGLRETETDFLMRRQSKQDFSASIPRTLAVKRYL